MTYDETLDYLFTQLPMYQRQGATAMKKDLGNIRVLLDWLGNPQEKLKCIHVGGTNGKGTVCHLIAAALQQRGHRVAMYTSPHYKDFRERIKLNGTFIPEQDVIDFTARLLDARLGIEASFFEITVAMAFDFFAREAPDYCLIEVGLGGRLDSTNVIHPLLSVITNIGLDHVQFLGDTLELIAGEKAGIIKYQTPVLIGRRQAETTAVFEQKAHAESARIFFADDLFETAGPKGGPQYEGVPILKNRVNGQPIPFPDSQFGTAPNALENMRTALAAIRLLGLIDVHTPTAAECDQAWAKLSELTHYVGRWQVLSEASPLAIADSAHNEDGLRRLIPRLLDYQLPLHIVLGVVSDKDLDGSLPLFPTSAHYYFAKADIPRGLPAEDLRVASERFGLKGTSFSSVAAAYAAATRCAVADGGMVFVGGSIFTVAEVL